MLTEEAVLGCFLGALEFWHLFCDAVTVQWPRQGVSPEGHCGCLVIVHLLPLPATSAPLGAVGESRSGGSLTIAAIKPAVRKYLTGSAAPEIASLVPVKYWTSGILLPETYTLRHIHSALKQKQYRTPNLCSLQLVGPDIAWDGSPLALLYIMPGFLEKLRKLVITSCGFRDLGWTLPSNYQPF